MYELIQVSENSFYIQCPAKIGIVKTGSDQVCLIDSGNDKDAGKKVKRILDSNGWELRAIFNTHAHADHIGGNQYLQKQTGCQIYAAGIERDGAEHTILEPSYLYGANPPGELRHKFTMAQESNVLPLTEDCLPDGLHLIDLPGHSWNMTGFRTAEDIVFLADCLSSEETLEKYGICFLVDVDAYLKTLETVRNMTAKLFVPAHAEPVENIMPLAEMNIQKVYEIRDRILKICSDPVSFECILKQLFDIYRLKMSFEQHALVGSTVRSYLTWLKENGLIEVDFRDNIMVWKTVCFRTGEQLK